ncbi:MAG: hypothetical protein A2992_03810 [Elusimicrobia bacterium RIFCSPLOWO2_01_FULL_59_12]|nr:MAG: hypothetical protein A2992_03810 [Elusimicrobia bacterium RIFCSPLOWO2_01_FULL_59_12]
MPRNRFFLLTACFVLRSAFVCGVDFPRGFFVEDLRRDPPAPAFYNLDAQRLEPLAFKTTAYMDFLDVAWDRRRGRIFFSARASRQEPFRVFVKDWPDGEEKSIYENPAGPFRFLISPDGQRLALQVMGPFAWPVLGVYDWKNQTWSALGQGHSPDWSSDGKSLLYLKIPGALPSKLYEYSVELDAAAPLIEEPVMEAVYTDDPQKIILKTASQAKRCDVYQVWNRRTDRFHTFSLEDPGLCKKKSVAQRELAAFPEHRFILFKESVGSRDKENQSLIVSDAWGGRLQSIPYDVWNPIAGAVEAMSLAMSEDPLVVVPADGAGRKREIAQARFMRVRH